MKISIIHNMARSGGTLIGKCLASMQDIVMLSEVHPAVMTPPFNPIQQARDWYKLFNYRDEVSLRENQSVTWLAAIELIQRRVACKHKHLLLRDWSHIDYTGAPWVKPNYLPSISDLLSKYYNIKRFYTVRHPIDQWLSLSKLAIIHDKLTIEDYLIGYLHFAQEAKRHGFIKYEDFTSYPEKNTRLLSEKLYIPYDPNFKNNWYSYKHITGDTVKENGKGSGRMSAAKVIKPQKRKPVTSELLEHFINNENYLSAIKILGYDI